MVESNLVSPAAQPDDARSLTPGDAAPSPAAPAAVEPVFFSEGDRHRLTTAQELALQSLAGGCSIADAARAAGISRRTLHRWIQVDSRFAAALNAWRQELVESGRARVLAMSNLALDTVQGALHKGDARIGLQIVRAAGLLTPTLPGPTSPKALRRLRRLRARLRALRESRRTLKLESDEMAHRLRAGNASHWWTHDVEKIEGFLQEFLEHRHRALAAEDDETRARRLDRASRTHHRYLTDMLQRLDARGVDFTKSALANPQVSEVIPDQPFRSEQDPSAAVPEHLQQPMLRSR